MNDAHKYIGFKLKGRYIIEDHIGSGLSAHAFKSYDTLLQGLVVVKIVKTVIAGVPIDLGEEWKEESRKAMQVRGHPHIAAILDIGEEVVECKTGEERIHFIVTEFIEGVPLKDVTSKNKRPDVSSLLMIAHQLLSTLEYLQARKLQHGDLHGGNIMVSEAGVGRPFIKIIDFGMASNTLIPRHRERDIHFALSQLDLLCQDLLETEPDPTAIDILKEFGALIKKAQNFIPNDRMNISDIIAEIEKFQQEIVKPPSIRGKTRQTDEGPRRRIAIQRRTPFVGRTGELERILKIITSSFLTKHGAICIISGEAGIGKTRLADEVLGKIAGEQTRLLLLYEKCSQQELNLPYAPVLEAIGNFLGGIPGEDNFESKLAVVLGPEHPLVKPLGCVLFEQQNVKLGLSSSSGEKPPPSNIPFLIASFLTQTSLTTPVVLFLDDLHWADKATIDFIEFLAHRISRTPVVVIITQRPEELVPSADLSEHPLVRLRKELGRNELAEIIDLGGLYGEDIEEILSNYYSFVKPADFAILAESVRRMVGGNPYYLFEITGLMEDEGYLVKHGDGKWVLKKDLTNFSIPPSINGLIKRRIDRLSLNEILLLRAAAIQGESFEISILERMFTPSGEELQEIIDNLLRNHGLIRALEPGRFAFGHNQVHKAIYNDIVKEDLVRGHSEVAKIIRQAAVENSTPIPHHRIAHHLALANQLHLAIEHLIEAGKRAIDAQQYHLAIDHLAKANDLLTPADLGSDLSVKLTLLLLESVKPLGERKIHVRAITQLKAISKLAGREDLTLRTMLEDCIFLRTISEHEQSLKAASDLIQLARERDNAATEAAALKEAGTTSYLMGNMEQAEEYFHLAAGILATTDDRAQLARVYNNLGLVCRNQQRFEEMVRYFERALIIFREIGDSMGERFPLGNLGIVYFERGEYERAYECFSTLKASLGERADLMMEGKVDFSIGEIYLEVGLYDHARSACESALDIFMTIGNRQGESEVLGTLGGIYLAKGDLQIAKEYFRQSVEIKRLIGNAVGMLHSKITLARIANMEGRHDEALSMVKEVLKSARERSLRSLELECLSEIMQAISQTEGADRALSVLGPSENPEHLAPGSSPALITFAYKAGELAFQTRDESRALKYIAVSGKSVEDILDKISIPEWREAFENKRRKILDTYRRLKPALPKM